VDGHLRAPAVALVELGRLEQARAVGRRLLAFDSKQTVTVAAVRARSKTRSFASGYSSALRAVGIRNSS
jgi:hypothetical protein